MPAVAIESELYKRAEEAAREQDATIGDILAEAVRRYLWELERRKISEEYAIYRRRHAELKSRYLGQYIAMHDGQIVDHDADFQILHQRIRQRFDRTPILITVVEDDPESSFIRHGFRMEAARS